MSKRRVIKVGVTRTPPYKRLYEQAASAAEVSALQADTARVEVEYWKKRATSAEDKAAGLASSANRFAREADRHAEARAMLIDDLQGLGQGFDLSKRLLESAVRVPTAVTRRPRFGWLWPGPRFAWLKDGGL